MEIASPICTQTIEAIAIAAPLRARFAVTSALNGTSTIHVHVIFMDISFMNYGQLGMGTRRLQLLLIDVSGSQNLWRNLTSNGKCWRIRHERETRLARDARFSSESGHRSMAPAVAVPVMTTGYQRLSESVSAQGQRNIEEFERWVRQRGCSRPRWQFLPSGATPAGLSDVLNALWSSTIDAWQIALWLSAPGEALGGMRARDWLQSNRPPERLRRLAWCQWTVSTAAGGDRTLRANSTAYFRRSPR
jgi:hypothetical protein